MDGGAGASSSYAEYAAGDLPASLTVVVGAGGTAGGLSGAYTAPYAWAPMNDAEKATAIEQIFTLDFANQIVMLFAAGERLEDLQLHAGVGDVATGV